MRSTNPPALAEWLLKQFGCSPNNNTIVGDLNERYGQGQSRLWYWRQAFVSIFISLWREVRSDGSLANRALVVGWSLELIAASTFVLLVQLLRRWPGRAGILPASWIGEPFLMVVMACALAFGVGWLMGRHHRPCHAKAVSIFVASQFLCFVLVFLFVLGKTLDHWSATNWRYDNPYFLALGVTGNVLAMLSTLMGGLLGGRSDSPRHEVRAI